MLLKFVYIDLYIVLSIPTLVECPHSKQIRKIRRQKRCIRVTGDGENSQMLEKRI